MVETGRAQYADPSSMIRAGAMLLDHIGYQSLSQRLNKALDICTLYEKEVFTTGRDTGATSQEFGEYLVSTVERADLDSLWQKHTQ